MYCYTNRCLFGHTADKKMVTWLKTSKYGNDLFSRCTTAIFEKEISLGFDAAENSRKITPIYFRLSTGFEEIGIEGTALIIRRFQAKWMPTILEIWTRPITKLLHVKVGLLISLFDSLSKLNVILLFTVKHSYLDVLQTEYSVEISRNMHDLNNFKRQRQQNCVSSCRIIFALYS